MVWQRSKLLGIFYKLVILLLVVIIIALCVVFTKKPEPVPSLSNRGAIVTNGYECADIGARIMMMGGSVVDATVSTMICEGITCPQSSGFGGGFLATIYLKDKGEFLTVDARETAPKEAHKDMYKNNQAASAVGGLSIAVPGELKGLWEMHQRYGKLKWADLIKPNIELARNGHRVTEYLSKILRNSAAKIKTEPSLSEIFIDPKTDFVWREGDIIRRPKLAESLEIIAQDGVDALYKKGGKLLKPLIEDIKKIDGIITEQDILDYRVRWGQTHKVEMKDYELHSNPLPGSGPVLSLIMNIINNYDLKNDSLSYHRLIEAFKFAYARRTRLGDEESDFMKQLVGNMTSSSYANDIKAQINDEKTSNDTEYYGAESLGLSDHGTAHVCLLAPNGDAVSITSTINWVFGSFRRSQSTGIILNNEMDDFSMPDYNGTSNDLPPSPANFIQAGKRPLSSMTPTIVLNKNGDVRLIIGGSGGSVITTSIAFVITEHLLKNRPLEDALAARRLHHQLMPMKLRYEKGFDKEIIRELGTKFEHDTQERPYDSGFSAMTAISKVDDEIAANYDRRRVGGSAVFYVY
jgi:gamma-glutamyltranspeptidase/glutathione hydrolase/leukotriene-C4 hydrolase